MQSSVEIDMIDRRILAALQADARLSSAQLGEQLALSQSPTWRRLKRLEDEGYISGYHAVLDRQKMRLSGLAVVHVGMDSHDGVSA